MKHFWLLVLVLSHEAFSDLPIPVKLADSTVTRDLTKPIVPGSFKGNNYFQASEQIFYVYDGPAPQRHPVIPKDYIILPNIGAYKFHSESKNWNDARNACIKEGAHLAVIRTPEENEFVKNVNKAKGVENAWLGVHDLFQSNDWVTVTDRPFETIGYAPWIPGEPNNHQNLNERCVCYAKTLGMNDLACHHNNSFHCKIELGNPEEEFTDDI